MLSSLLRLPPLLGPRPREQKSRLLHTQTHHQLVCELLQELNPYISMGPENTHPRELLEELADIVVRPFSVIFEKSLEEGSCHPHLRRV